MGSARGVCASSQTVIWKVMSSQDSVYYAKIRNQNGKKHQ